MSDRVLLVVVELLDKFYCVLMFEVPIVDALG